MYCKLNHAKIESARFFKGYKHSNLQILADGEELEIEESIFGQELSDLLPELNNQFS